MTKISVRELGHTAEGHSAVISFDDGGEYSITISNPFTPEQEHNLQWYYEEHLKFPFTNQVTARQIASSLDNYGETLFNQLFAERDVYAHYKTALQNGIDKIRMDIAGSPQFHSLHWEALKDPQRERPLSVDIPILRRNLKPPPIRSQIKSSPTINLLIVTARPGGSRDVGYRTISRPLVEQLSRSPVRVNMDILRPGTFKALQDHLVQTTNRHGVGYYHIIHFDVHGKMMTYDQFIKKIEKTLEPNHLSYQARYGRDDLKPYEGQKAFLFLETEREGQYDPVEASELAHLLRDHQIPISILNACQSAMQQGQTETSLASHLMGAGAQTVLAMGYSVTVSAAELMMPELYKQLFDQRDLTQATRLARLELHNRKGRRAYYNQIIDLEDWLLPVVYQNQPVTLNLTDFSDQAARQAFYEKQASSYEARPPTYGFVGRDLDILIIERKILQHNILLVKGMGGAGKTTLLQHLGEWWQKTNFVAKVFYFGYDERAYTRQQLLHSLAEKLFDAGTFHGAFLPLQPEAQQRMLAEALNKERHLLILDNLESITGERLAIPNTLTEKEQQEVKAFLKLLRGGKSLVLLGSRSDETWLQEDTFNDNSYDLPGLDPEAASTLVEKILDKIGKKAKDFENDNDFNTLVSLLDGYPLPLEVLLPNLKTQTPSEILKALQSGDETIDFKSKDKTQSVLRSIEYSYSNLAEADQKLLMFLAPFSSVISSHFLPQYIEQLKNQEALKDLPFERWSEVIVAAKRWGLITEHPQVPRYLSLQPTFPFFLRARLKVPEQESTKEAIETAFRLQYDWIATVFYDLMESNDPQEKQLGLELTGLEFENINTALRLSLSAKASIQYFYVALSGYVDNTQQHQLGLELGNTVMAELETLPAEVLEGKLEIELVGVVDNVATRFLKLKRYQEAETTYRKGLDLLQASLFLDATEKLRYSASIYHQLSRVVGEQRQWERAEKYCQQALAIKIEFNDRYEQADTYHQLGGIAEQQQQLVQAEKYYQQALAIRIEFNDRPGQASIYHHLGVVTQKKEQWEQAKQYYQQALAINIEFNYRYEQARTYHNLGVLAQSQHQLEQAENYYQQALAIKIEFNDRYGQASTYHQLGSVVMGQQLWPQAINYFLIAVTIFVEYEDNSDVLLPLHSLAQIWRETNDDSILTATTSALQTDVETAKTRLEKLLEDE